MGVGELLCPRPLIGKHGWTGDKKTTPLPGGEETLFCKEMAGAGLVLKGKAKALRGLAALLGRSFPPGAAFLLALPAAFGLGSLLWLAAALLLLCSSGWSGGSSIGYRRLG